MVLVQSLVGVFAGYAAFGVLFAIAFVTKGISRVDPAAKGSSAGFKLIILPGVAAMWPLFLARWIQQGHQRA
jgi:hypothetical protein